MLNLKVFSDGGRKLFQFNDVFDFDSNSSDLVLFIEQTASRGKLIQVNQDFTPNGTEVRFTPEQVLHPEGFLLYESGAASVGSSDIDSFTLRLYERQAFVSGTSNRFPYIFLTVYVRPSRHPTMLQLSHSIPAETFVSIPLKYLSTVDMGVVQAKVTSLPSQGKLFLLRKQLCSQNSPCVCVCLDPPSLCSNFSWISTDSSCLAIGDEISAVPVVSSLSQVGYMSNKFASGVDQFSFGYTWTNKNVSIVSRDRASITLKLRRVNHQPVCQDFSVSVSEGLSLPLQLQGSDPDGDLLNYFITADPLGTLALPACEASICLIGDILSAKRPGRRYIPSRILLRRTSENGSSMVDPETFTSQGMSLSFLPPLPAGGSLLFGKTRNSFVPLDFRAANMSLFCASRGLSEIEFELVDYAYLSGFRIDGSVLSWEQPLRLIGYLAPDFSWASEKLVYRELDPVEQSSCLIGNQDDLCLQRISSKSKQAFRDSKVQQDSDGRGRWILLWSGSIRDMKSVHDSVLSVDFIQTLDFPFRKFKLLACGELGRSDSLENRVDQLMNVRAISILGSLLHRPATHVRNATSTLFYTAPTAFSSIDSFMYSFYFSSYFQVYCQGFGGVGL
jgi:hypothetical protein